MRSAHLWSIFVTALYALGDDERMFFLDTFAKLEAVSSTRSATQAAQSIVQTVWKRRDFEVILEPSSNKVVSDWVKYIRPLSEGLSLA